MYIQLFYRYLNRAVYQWVISFTTEYKIKYRYNRNHVLRRRSVVRWQPTVKLVVFDFTQVPSNIHDNDIISTNTEKTQKHTITFGNTEESTKLQQFNNITNRKYIIGTIIKVKRTRPHTSWFWHCTFTKQLIKCQLLFKSTTYWFQASIERFDTSRSVYDKLLRWSIFFHNNQFSTLS